MIIDFQNYTWLDNLRQCGLFFDIVKSKNRLGMLNVVKCDVRLFTSMKVILTLWICFILSIEPGEISIRFDGPVWAQSFWILRLLPSFLDMYLIRLFCITNPRCVKTEAKLVYIRQKIKQQHCVCLDKAIISNKSEHSKLKNKLLYHFKFRTGNYLHYLTIFY